MGIWSEGPQTARSKEKKREAPREKKRPPDLARLLCLDAHTKRTLKTFSGRGLIKTQEQTVRQSRIVNSYSQVGAKPQVITSITSHLHLSPHLKPRLRVTRHAEDPFLIGRELISQGCDWPNENLVSIPAKQPKLFQVLLSFPWSTRARGLFRSARVSKKF